MSNKKYKKKFRSISPFLIGLVIVLVPIIYFVVKNIKAAEAAWYNDYWHYRKKLTIDHTKVSGSTNLTDFPVLISITSDADLTAKAQADGDDLLFTDALGNRLDHEIESYSSGTLTAWVRVPTVFATEYTNIYLYYGNPSATAQSNKKGVWKNYAAVWHLNEDQSGTGNLDLYKDATGNGWDGDDYVSSTTKTGVILNGQDFDGTDDYITMGNINTILGVQKLTMSAWMKRDASNAYNFVGKQKATSYDNNIFLEYYSDGKLYYDMSNSGNGFGDVTNNNTNWHYISMVFDGSQTGNSNRLKGYIDGASQTLTFTGTVPSTTTSDTTSFQLGRDPAPTYQSSPIDEVRVYLGTQSADWIATEYANHNSPSTFFTAGSQEKGSGPSLFLRLDEGMDNTCTGGSNDACDVSGNVNDGAISNGTAWKTSEYCVAGNCLFFDGTDDVLTVNTSNTIDLSDDLTSVFTIQGWAKPNSDGEGNTGEIFQKGTNTYARITNEGTDGFADLEVKIDLGTTDATKTVTNGIDLNKWNHIAITYTDDADDEITVYIDGVNKGSSTDGSGSPATDTNNLLIGGSTSANFHGYIDEFKIYPLERSATQIAADGAQTTNTAGGSTASLGNKDLSYIADGLLGYWKLDETSGNASDASGNSLTLTNNGTTTYVTGRYSYGSEHVPASSQYLSTATTINNIKTVTFWTNPDSTTNYYLSLTASAYIQSTSGTLSAVGISNAKIYVNGVETTKIEADKWQLITVTTDTAINADTFYIGRIGSNYFDGTMDEVRVLSNQLSKPEAENLFKWGPLPVLYWDLNENNGTSTVYDKSGNANNGTLNGTMTAGDWIGGKYGSALDLDGSDDNISRADDADLDFTADQNFTLSAWIKHTTQSSGVDIIMSKYENSGADGGYTLQMEADGDISFGTDDDATTFPNDRVSSTAATYDDNQWHFVTGVKVGTTSLKLYIDGAFIGSTTITEVGTLANDDTFYVGRDGDNTTQSWLGQIDEVKVYNYERTNEQIIEDMNASHPNPGSPIGSAAGYWTFGDMLNTVSGIEDLSPNNNDLSFGGTASLTASGKFGIAAEGASNARFTRSDDDDFDFIATDDFTLSIWFKRSTISNDEYLISKIQTNLGYGVWMDSTGDIIFGTSDQGSAAFPEETIGNLGIDYDDGNWHHAVAVKSGTSYMRLYIDGNEIASDTSISETNTLANSGVLYIGDGDNTDGSNEFLGTYDEIKIFRSALTAEQVKVLYNQTSSLVFGATGTTSAGVKDNSTSRFYCIPGDSTSCDSPVLHLKLDENNGQRINSSSENSSGLFGGESTLGANSSVSTDDPAWTIGKYGSALDFDGSNDLTTMAEDDDMDFANGVDFTIEGWIKRDTHTSEDIILAKGPRTTSGTDTGYIVWLDSTNDVINFRAYDGTAGAAMAGSTAIGRTTLDNNTWHHFAILIDEDNATNSTIYVDGTAETISTSGSSITAMGSLDNASGLVIGASRNGGGPFDGKIDDLRIYRYARTPAQIFWDYNEGRQLGYWKFDECQGTTAYDSTGRGNNGTLNFGASGNTSAGTCSSGTSTEMWNDGTTGKINSAIGLDGTNDYVQVTDTAKLRFDSSAVDFSLFAWVKRTTTGTEYIISKEDADNDGYRLMFNSSDQVVCSEDSTDVTSTSSITDTNWHFIGCTIDRDGNGQVYIDGAANGSTSAMGTDAMATTANITFGTRSYTATNYFNGLLDEVMMFNYMLNPYQIKVLYGQGTSKFN